MFSEAQKNDQFGNILTIGDVVWLKLSERTFYLAFSSKGDPFDTMVAGQQQGHEDEVVSAGTGAKGNRKASSALDVDFNFARGVSQQSHDAYSAMIKKKSGISWAGSGAEPDELNQPSAHFNLDVPGLLRPGPVVGGGAREDHFDIETELTKDIEIEFIEISLMKFTSLQENISVNSSGLWRLEGQTLSAGGMVRWDGFYRLKNVKTGLYLRVRAAMDKVILELSKERDDDSLFQFVPLPNINPSDEAVEKFVSKDSFFQLRHWKTEKWVTFPSEAENGGRDENDFDHLPHTKKTPGLLTKLRNSRNRQVKLLRQPVLSDKKNEMDTFLMRRTDYEEIWEISFIMSSLHNIQKMMKAVLKINALTSGESTTVNSMGQLKFEDRAKKFNAALNDLIDFSTNKLSSNIAINQDYGNPSPYRQQMLRDLSVLGFLTWLLSKTFPKPDELRLLDQFGGSQNVAGSLVLGSIEKASSGDRASGRFATKVNQYEKLRKDLAKKKYELAMKIYDVISEMVMENKLSQEYIFKFLPIIKKHIGYGENVSRCLSVCLEKNDKLIYSLYKPLGLPDLNAQQRDPAVTVGVSGLSILEEIISRLKLTGSYSRGDIIELLTKVCTCDGKAIFINQDKIFKMLFENEDMKSCIIDLQKDPESDSLLVFLDGQDNQHYEPSHKTASSRSSHHPSDRKPGTEQYVDLTSPQAKLAQAGPFMEESEDERERIKAKKSSTPKGRTPGGSGGGPFRGARIQQSNTSAFESFFENGKIKRHPKQMKFLRCQLNLISALCAERNYLTREHFAPQFQMQTLLGYVNHEDIPLDFKAALICLMRNLYVDADSMSIQNKPNLVRTLDVDGDDSNGSPDLSPLPMNLVHSTSMKKNKEGVVLMQDTRKVAVKGSAHGSQPDNDALSGGNTPLRRRDDDDQPLITRKKASLSEFSRGEESQRHLKKDMSPPNEREEPQTTSKNFKQSRTSKFPSILQHKSFASSSCSWSRHRQASSSEKRSLKISQEHGCFALA